MVKLEQRDYKGITVNLMRIDNMFAWYSNINGKDYGTFSKVIFPEDMTKENIEEETKVYFGVHLQNAVLTIDFLLK